MVITPDTLPPDDAHVQAVARRASADFALHGYNLTPVAVTPASGLVSPGQRSQIRVTHFQRGPLPGREAANAEMRRRSPHHSVNPGSVIVLPASGSRTS